MDIFSGNKSNTNLQNGSQGGFQGGFQQPNFQQQPTFATQPTFGGSQISTQPTFGGAQTSTQTQFGLNKGPDANGVFNLGKGDTLSLTKVNTALNHIKIGLGWDPPVDQNGFTAQGVQFDLDAMVFLLGADHKVVTQRHFVFYKNLISPDGCVKHSGDNRTGMGDGDDESIDVLLRQVQLEVKRIAVVISIDDAIARNQKFGDVRNAFARIEDQLTHKEIARFDLTQRYSDSICLIVGEFVRIGDSTEWTFEARGEGTRERLDVVCHSFGEMINY